MPTLTQKIVQNLPVTGEKYDLRDDKVKGFLIRVSATGEGTYVCQYTRGKRLNIGKVNILTLEQARNRARKIITDFADGVDPKAARRKVEAEGLTLGQFLAGDFQKHMKTHHTRQDADQRIRVAVPSLLDVPLIEIDADKIASAIEKRVAAGKKPGTINKEIAITKAALQLAVEWNLIPANPMAKTKLVKTDRKGVVRYLKPAEKQRLMDAIDALGAGDRLRPMVLVSLFSGVRFGELTQLRWKHVDFVERKLTVAGETAKSRQSRHIDMHPTVVAALTAWHSTFTPLPKQAGLIFPGEKDPTKPLDNVNKSWHTLLRNADIEDFRWHDMRHTFASWLVQRGQPLTVVRDLLGHASLQMTQRYAHLVESQMTAAVNSL